MFLRAFVFYLLIISACLNTQPGLSEETDGNAKVRLSASTLNGLKLRSIGPALMSGRIADIAIDPEAENTWYVAAGSGGLWKTTNAGTTWKPVFENYDSYSIGCVTIDPRNRHVIWVGSGEAVGGRHVGFGDGVYVSRDGGERFENVGLKESEHIAKILVDPRDSNVIFVAAQGPLWSPGGQRGLYRSRDGGKTWHAVLAKGEYTGCTDIAFNPRNPDIIYAAMHQRHRTVWSLINGGPESGIFKSVDGGDNWRELTAGLPGGDKGKIGIAVSPLKPDVIYATIELAGRKGGFWRSENGGESWSKQDDYISGGTGPHYYQEIWCDPHRFDVVYQANVMLGRTEDGGRTWKSVYSPAKHVDNHAVAFRKSDRDFVLVGCDGGLYRSYDYCQTYQHVGNLPLTQFYKLALDNEYPFYNVVGGTQDNATLYGPTRTRSRSGILTGDWRITIGGDGHDCAIDPEDPNIIYCESQQGYLRRFDRRSGESVDIRPQPENGEEALRFNWDSPILISPHDHKRLYFGSRLLHRSDDRGDSWRAVSPDLSRNQDRFLLKVMNRVWSIDAIYDLYAMSQYGNITSIAESPLVEGLIYVGTDDGLIQVTEDGGENWRRVDRIFDVPQNAFVNDIKADLHDADTVYALFDDHKTGDLRPYVVKSTDRGQTWKSIVGDLPDRHLAWRIIQDHEKPDLLFLGTEFGLFCTINGGEHWLKLSGGVPNIPFRDIEIQRRENDLVGATFGRSFYVLDDYSPLRTMTEELLSDDELVIFPVRNALRYLPDRPLGGKRGSRGDDLFVADNPPFGAVFTYYLRDTLKSRKARRKEKEQKIKKALGDNKYPGWEELRKEKLEEDPTIVLAVTDEAGRLVRRLEAPASEGLHRIAWDLRFGPLGSTQGRGPLAPPGRYRISAAKLVDDELTKLGDPQEFEVVSIGESSLPAADPEAVLEFQQSTAQLLLTLSAAARKTDEVLEQVEEMRKALQRSHLATDELMAEARQMQLKLKQMDAALTTDPTKEVRGVDVPPSIVGRVRGAMFATIDNTYGPTLTQRRNLEIAREQYQEIESELRTVIETDFPKLQGKLDQAGIAWTSGRQIPSLP